MELLLQSEENLYRVYSQQKLPQWFKRTTEWVWVSIGIKNFAVMFHAKKGEKIENLWQHKRKVGFYLEHNFCQS